MSQSGKLKLLFLLTVGTILLICGCQSKVSIAPKQENGLYYRFIEYIGPDSCKLYECAYQKPGDNEAHSIFMTVCDDKKSSSVHWSEKHGKSTCQYDNVTTMTDTLSNYTFTDTIIKMVPKIMTQSKNVTVMVPETCLVMRKKK